MAGAGPSIIQDVTSGSLKNEILESAGYEVELQAKWA